MGRKNQRGTFGKGWRTKDKDILNPENYGLPKRKSALDEIEDTPVIVKRTETIQDRIKVGETPIAKKRITNAGEYPEDAIIISMGPTNAGKTKYLEKVFDKESIYTYTRTINNTHEEENINLRKKYIEQIKHAVQDIEKKKVVIDTPYLDCKFRARIYKIAKDNGRPVFIINHICTYEQCLKRINDKYGDEIQNSTVADNRNKSLKILQKSYAEFLRVVPELQAELEKYGVIESEYSSQIVDIIHAQKQKSNEGNAVSER